MPLNTRPLIVFDLETNSIDIHTASILEIGAIVLDPISLEPIEGGEFHSYLGYSKEVIEGWDQMSFQDATRKNGITVDQLIEAPDHKVVFESFVSFIEKYDTSDSTRSTRLKPIFAGFNIDAFDIPIVTNLAGKYGRATKEGRPDFVSSMTLDMYRFLFWSFDSLKVPERLSMDAIRDWMGIPSEGAHTAMKDVRDCVWLIQKFIRYQRKLAEANNRKGVYQDCYGK